MVKNAPIFLIMKIFQSQERMDYLYFPEQNLSEYELNGNLLNHSNISESNRARLFSWLSEECTKQKISRFSFVLACTYIDLYFMKKNDIDVKNYQLLALGALILSTKQVEAEGKIPIIDLHLFKPEKLLGMEKTLVFALDFYLNPPIYVELLNNIAKMWDIKCDAGQISSSTRYFTQNKDSFLRLKTLYEKMDSLYLFKRILDFNLEEVILTLFYSETKRFHTQSQNSQQSLESSIRNQMENPEEVDYFKNMFQNFLQKSQISSKLNPQIQKIISFMTKQKFSISDKVLKVEGTFGQMLSYQSFNSLSHKFFRKYHSKINEL